MRVEFDPENSLTLLWKENWINESDVYFIQSDGNITSQNTFIIEIEYSLWQKQYLSSLTYLVKNVCVERKNMYVYNSS